MSERQATYSTDAPVPDLLQLEAMAVLIAQARIAGHSMGPAFCYEWSLMSECLRGDCGAWVRAMPNGSTDNYGLSDPCRRSPERGLPAVYDRELGEE